MHSYLLSRSRYVQIDSWKSPLLPIKCGVPQCSVLGSLLFFIYINDVFSCSNYLSFILFADDTNIFFQHKNISELTKIVNHELSFVATWFKANKLTVHPDKTKFILFNPARKKINLDGLSINIDKNSINRVEHTKFLGVIVHQNLSWQAHIKAISSKIAKSTGIIIKSRQFFLSNTLCTLYNSLILPYLQYCSIIWASTYSSHLQPFFHLQKKALRIIAHSPPRAHTFSLTNSKYSTYLMFISTKFLALFSFTCRSSCPLLFQLFSFLTLIVINISPGKKTTCIFILINTLFLFGYRVLKFGMTFLSHFIIHLLFLVININ